MLIQSTIVLAPDLVDLPRLITNVRRYSFSYRKLKLERLKELAENSANFSNDDESVNKTFEEVFAKITWIFTHPEGKVTFDDDGEKQACMWLLCTMFCDQLKLLEKKNVFYAGTGFGEFWALTYRMYKTKQISFKMAVKLAKSRGTKMSLCMGQYSVLNVKELKRDNLYSLLPKKTNIGVLALNHGRYYLYGKDEELKRIARSYDAKPKKSVPYFTPYLTTFARLYAMRFPNANSPVDPQIISANEVNSNYQLLIKQLCESADERMLMKEISCYEPYDLKTI